MSQAPLSSLAGVRPGNKSVRGMRAMATAMLVAMAAIFFAADSFDELYPALGFVKAFAEAAMVGGLADWFAVTALFRHPLGLPIPPHRDHPAQQGPDRRDPRILPSRQFPHPLGGREEDAQRRRRRSGGADSCRSRPPKAGCAKAARGWSPTCSNRSIRNGSAGWSRAPSPRGSSRSKSRR
jgi:hypothetical protein